MTNIHAKIIELRKLKGFSQQNMADKLGISQMAYSKIERNETQLTVKKINELSKILNVGFWVLVDDEKKINENDPINTDKTISLLEKLFSKQEHQIESLKLEIKYLKEQLALSH